MPRADPTRSDYCASRHLLRNLDDAAELRRNPLVRDYFDRGGTPRRRDAAADRAALDRIRGAVRASLARCGEFADRNSHDTLGRMHAALLRCDIDDQPAPAVAAELGLSERQLRRDRRTAHDAFARAFRASAQATPSPATTCDVATVRLAQAVELHELGLGALARSAFASIAGGAPTAERRIEALCLAAEAGMDAQRHGDAAAHLAEARAVMALHAREFDDEAARASDEHVDFVAWLLRWQTVVSAGLAAPPPLLLAAAADDRARGERRRALFVRATAAYAIQRWEVGDGLRGGAAVVRGLRVMRTLNPARAKEQLAIAMADAHLYDLSAPRGKQGDRFRAVEKLAASHGHVHVWLAARADRIGGEAAASPTAVGRIFDDILRPFGAAERRDMARAFGWSAQIIAQCEEDPSRAGASAQLAERIAPARSAAALMARCNRAEIAIGARRYDDARPLVQSVYADADVVGNGRVRAAAARGLAAIALGCRRKSEAQRYIREALSLGEHFSSPESLTRTNALARRLDVA